MPVIEVPDPSVVVLIGPAGAGKSTFAARHFPAGAILASDAFREVISGDPADQAATGAAFAALHRELGRRLAAGRTAVVDATNLTAAARRTIRHAARRHDVPMVAIVFDLPASLVQSRNAARPGRVVPDDAVARHLSMLARLIDRDALSGEGYARVVHLRDPADVDAVEVRLVAAQR